MVDRPTDSDRILHVAVLVAHNMPMGQEHLKGVAHYVSHHPQWVIHTTPRRGFAPLKCEEDFKGHGMIVHIGSREHAERCRRLPFPVVNIGALVLNTGLPSVLPDNEAIGRSAFWHFWERGFRRFGFCGYRNHGYAIARRQGFAAACAAQGLEINDYPDLVSLQHDLDDITRFAAEEAEMSEWLRSFAKPAAIFAASDQRSRQLLEACRRARIKVPEEIAILGVDDDHVLCLSSHPQLSSIAVPYERIGYEAAALLARLMAGEKPPVAPILLPPVGIISRGSTDIIATPDRAVAISLRYLRENARQRLNVRAIAAASGLNRRTLERRFHKEVGHSLHTEITRVRLETAKQYLRQTDLPLAEVAKQAGFSSLSRLCQVFRQELKITPKGYRTRFRDTARNNAL